MNTILARPKSRRLIAAMIGFVLFLLPGTAQALTTAWICGPSGCKYEQVRVQYTAAGPGGIDQQHQVWGSTASGTCDPTNDGIRWRIERTRLVTVNSIVQFDGGPYSWHTNCTIDNSPPPPSGWWFVTINKSWSQSPSTKMEFWVFHDHACTGCDFTDYAKFTFP